MNYPYGPQVMPQQPGMMPQQSFPGRGMMPPLAPNNALAPWVHASVVRPGVQAANDWRMAFGRPPGLADWQTPITKPVSGGRIY